MLSSDPPSVRLLRVVDERLVFGCVKAVDLRGAPANIIVYENIVRPYMVAPPPLFSILLCRLYHSSVFLPVAEVVPSHVWVRRMLPDDVARAYFPMTTRDRIAWRGAGLLAEY